MSLSPFVFIGIGGSGGKTLRAIRQALEAKLDEIGWQEPWPHAWQLLHIDVPAEPDGVLADLPMTLPRKSYASCTTKQSQYRTTEAVVGRTNVQGLEHYLAWDCWRPYPPEDVRVDITLGAGQFRAVGRVALLGALKEIDQRIQTAVSAASHPEAPGQLHRIELARRQEVSPPSSPRPQVYVIASVAGGSGSGALLDVCDLLRARGHHAVTAVVFTPEVFEDSDGHLESGISPNSFIAMCELMSSAWISRPPDSPRSRNTLFQRAGINPPVDRSGPESVFLVGRRNADVQLGTAIEIYKVMGRSLAELVLSHTLQSGLNAYSAGNAMARSRAISHTLPIQVTGRVDAPHLHGLGFAKLSMGRDVFRQYSIERLARRAVERLLDKHLGARYPGEAVDDATLIEREADKRWRQGFLRDSGLNEVGKENDLTDALHDKDAIGTALDTWQANTYRDLASAGGGRPRSTSEIRGAVAQAVEQQLGPTGLRAAAVKIAANRAREWRPQIHERLARLVTREMALSGLPVTRRLLDLLLAETDRAVSDLGQEARQRLEGASTLASALSTPRPEEPARVPLDADGPVRAILADGRTVLRHYVRYEQVRIAHDLMKDVRVGLVKALADAVRDAEQTLRREARGVTPSRVDFWPSDKGIPLHLRPSAVEFLLDDLDAFPVAFGDVVRRSVREADSVESAIGMATAEVITGPEHPDHHQTPPALHYRGTWTPEWEHARRQDEQPTRASVQIHVSLDDLLARARAWVADSQRSIGRYVTQSLSDYLTDGEVGAGVRADRRARLLGQFAATLRVALPLVSLDPSLLQQVHGVGQPAYSLEMSPLDLPAEDARLVLDLENVATSVLGSPVSIPRASGPAQETQVMTILTHPYHPVTFSSLMDPVVNQWLSDRDDPSFWLWRRTRPVTEWVPLAPDAQQALIEGWLVARLLGRARIEVDEFRRVVLSVLVPDERLGSSWLALPTSGIRALSRDDSIGNVLELVAVALLEVYRTKTLEPLRPFGALMRLGEASGEEHALVAWIRTGRGVERPEHSILFSHVGSEPLTEADARATAVRAVLAAQESLYKGDAAQWANPHLPLEKAQGQSRIEVAPGVLRAIGRLTDLTYLPDTGSQR